MGFSGARIIKNTTYLKLFLFFNALLCMYGLSRLTGSENQHEEIITSNIREAKYHNENFRRLLTDSIDRSSKYSKGTLCDCSKCPFPVDSAPNRTLSVVKRPKHPSKIGNDLDTSKRYQVPNIVHYIWYNTQPARFQFHHMLSVMSVSKFIKPDVIYFHTDNQPIGEFWERTKKIQKLKIVKRNPPTRLFGEDVKPPNFYTSHSNVDRLKVLMEYGGIYLDFDVFAIRSFDELRKHVITIGFESEEKSCGSIIVSSKDAFFLILWLNSYFDDYKTDEWAYNTGKVPFNLANRYPNLVNVEKRKLNRPNFNELNLLFGDKTWNWKENYAVHTWYRLWKDWSGMFKGIEPNMTNINTLNNTFGQIARTILYDSPDMKL